MPQRIIYHTPDDAQTFNRERFKKSLQKYDSQVSDARIDELLAEFEGYDVLHASVLVEIGTRAMTTEEAAKEYFGTHNTWFDENTPNFERLRRITGYLVGTLDRWNDGKKAEEKARVKHNVSMYDPENKAAIEVLKYENSVMSQI